LECPADKVCEHFEIGQIKLQYKVSRPNTPTSSVSSREDNIFQINNVPTPEASTRSNSSSPIASLHATPENMSFRDMPSRPTKRLNSKDDSDDSDDSYFIFRPQLKEPTTKRRFLIPETDSDESIF
jgi:hypothetical protein